MDPTTKRSLSLLLKHYAALSPSTAALLPSPPFPSSQTLSLSSTQRWIVNNLLSLDQDNPENGSVWKKGFWKRIVRGIEEGFEERRAEEGEESVEDEEVEAEILERMVEYLSSSPSASNSNMTERTYYWADLNLGRKGWKCVKTREEARMISGGTTGLRTWQACIALSNHFLVESEAIRESKRIVELGAGVGLLSLVAATLKQPQGEHERGTIVSTDVDEKVLELLDSNVKLNKLEGRVKTMKLDWELAWKLETEQEQAAGIERSLKDWEQSAFGSIRADLIIGADIVYDPSLTAQLAATISWLLRPDTLPVETKGLIERQAIIAGTIRNESTWELFLKECRSRMLNIEEVELRRFEDGSGLVGAEGWEGEGQVRVVRITRSS
ncbi:uncharacterized protein JCM6883_002859 [Sporobolomyces salmoneus]|uniref:uncharacterized protein n=1 Tax=Sporobolomyces salmoneus TaxID=183962 RepID=UPI00317AEDDD